jgi:dihydrofolate synthase/folylpolyglutamate synthase
VRTIQDSIALLEGLGPSTIALGMERIHRALTALGNPERSLRVLHVAGTNGKGSTCAFASAILRAAGRRVGLYASPHLVRVNERWRIDGEPIPDALLAQRIEELAARLPWAITGPQALTYFEFGTLLAFWHFAREGVEVVVLETGLGGRLDATNACLPAVCALTAIDFDHQQYLGPTLAGIAAEKAGILKPGVPAVTARQPPEVEAVLVHRASELGVALSREGATFSLEAEADGTLTYADDRGRIPRLALGLLGPHQRQNAAVAVAAVRALDRVGIDVDPATIRSGLAAARWPGRFEVIPGEPTVVLDGAHNPAGARVLAAALRSTFPAARKHLVFGVLADKDVGPMLEALVPEVASVWLVAPESPRALAPEAMEAQVRSFGRPVTSCSSLQAALAGARKQAGSGDVVVIAGSLVLIGSAAALH